MTADDDVRVETLMEPDPPVAHLHETLDRATSRLRASGGETLAVVDGDRIVAVLSRTALDALCAAVDDPATDCLRDHCRPPVPFCFAHETLPQATSVLTVAAAEGASATAIAVVDEQRRLVGVIEAQALRDSVPTGTPRPPEDATDRSGELSPNLTVYAPWAVLDD